MSHSKVIHFVANYSTERTYCGLNTAATITCVKKMVTCKWCRKRQYFDIVRERKVIAENKVQRYR